MSRSWRNGLLVGAAVLCGLWLLNASWLAPQGHGAARVIAQRGMGQDYQPSPDDFTCTARLILPPRHPLIDNTLPAIEAAIAVGADVVEMDLRMTADHAFVLFHDDGLACRTEGTGRVAEHVLADLQTLDVGYGYTADGGRSFPLRGKGVGMMPALGQVLLKYPRQHFLLQIKDRSPEVAEHLDRYLSARGQAPWGRLSFFGSPAPLARLQQLHPQVRTWTAGGARRCLVDYLGTGWMGWVPRACEGGMVIVPVEQAGLLWGWPQRFLARMREHHTEVMLIGRIDTAHKGQFSRLDSVEQLARVPAGFEGSIWTDQVAVIGPAMRDRKGGG